MLTAWFTIWFWWWKQHASLNFKSSLSCDIMCCSLLKVRLMPASCWVLASLTFQLWRWRWHVPLKRQLNFNGLHIIVSWKTELFITIVLRTSNSTMVNLYVPDHTQDNIYNSYSTASATHILQIVLKII